MMSDLVERVHEAEDFQGRRENNSCMTQQARCKTVSRRDFAGGPVLVRELKKKRLRFFSQYSVWFSRMPTFLVGENFPRKTAADNSHLNFTRNDANIWWGKVRQLRPLPPGRHLTYTFYMPEEKTHDKPTALQHAEN